MVVSLVVTSIITYQLWKPLKENWGIQIFYLGIAFLIFGLSFVLWRESKRNSFKIFLTSFMALSAMNLFDEIFGNPSKVQWWEYGCFIAITLNFLYAWIRKIKNK